MDFRPWMIETAFDFIRSARLLWEHEISSPSMVNAAIGLEILFKSFNSEVDGHKGGIGEKYLYAGKRRHNLLDLFDAIPKDLRAHLGFDHYRSYFEGRASELFILARYPYEREAIAGGSEAIIEVAEEMCGLLIQEYKRCGCDDPWIVGVHIP